MRKHQSFAVVVATLFGAVLLSAQGTRQEVEAFLKSSGLPAADVPRLDAGEVIARADMPDRDDEVVTGGAVKIRASRQQVSSYYAQMITYGDGKVTLAFGRFSSPPVVTDVRGLSFDRAEVDELKSCRPGDGALRLGAARLTQMRPPRARC